LTRYVGDVVLHNNFDAVDTYVNSYGNALDRDDATITESCTSLRRISGWV